VNEVRSKVVEHQEISNFVSMLKTWFGLDGELRSSKQGKVGLKHHCNVDVSKPLDLDLMIKFE
jgi:uncharacterized protein YchJ